MKWFPYKECHGAFLAGALGVKTTLMLCAASEWRWGLERTDQSLV